jgi:hypothetical protein
MIHFARMALIAGLFELSETTTKLEAEYTLWMSANWT